MYKKKKENKYFIYLLSHATCYFLFEFFSLWTSAINFNQEAFLLLLLLVLLAFTATAGNKEEEEEEEEEEVEDNEGGANDAALDDDVAFIR